MILLTALGCAQTAMAHSVGGPIDLSNNNASATDVAGIICDSASDHLAVQIKDSSPAVPGMYVSLQVFKDNKMTNTTDNTPGDANGSRMVSLFAGSGMYMISVNKTLPGTRQIAVEYHCEDRNNEHTGTDIVVFQIQ